MELMIKEFFQWCDVKESQTDKNQIIIENEAVDFFKTGNEIGELSIEDFNHRIFHTAVIQRLVFDHNWEQNIDEFFDYHYSLYNEKNNFLKYLKKNFMLSIPLLNKVINDPEHPNSEWAKHVLKSIEQWIEIKEGSIEEIENKETGYSRRKTVLAFYFLQEVDKFPRSSEDATKDQSFYQFLTGRRTEFRKLISEPFKRPLKEQAGKSTKELIKDIRIVQKQFHEIGFYEADNIIENTIDILKKDIKSFED